jgi:asparagine synthase (glutamine-hydrolysing)
MCGIAEVISSSYDIGDILPKIELMTEAQSHRGPDDTGCEVIAASHPAVAFGHRRLAIIDLSSAGHQPMGDPETGNWITYNGEIYNFKELRRELSDRGYIFKTHSDTEVILKAYAAWGPACVQRFRGIFAFGIWDKPHRRLILVRDHLGVNPIYFWRSAYFARIVTSYCHSRFGCGMLFKYI